MISKFDVRDFTVPKVYVRTCTYVCTYIDTHKYTHTYVRTYVLVYSSSLIKFRITKEIRMYVCTILSNSTCDPVLWEKILA